VRKKQKQNIYCSYFFFFEGAISVLCVRMEPYKVVIAGGSNNAGVWVLSPQPPEANGGSGADPRR